MHALRILSVGIAVAGITPLVSAYFQSLGRAGPAYLMSVGSLVLVKAPLVAVCGTAGVNGVWVGLTAGEVVSALVALTLLGVFPRRG
ncbi:hypothetical protein KIH74_24195 [Kineosporia sp. J2-2]|uniref:Uncharacterized protein n=1 Tax=Kineosporia corallincola TaxID=2835133 RepID=A0ABS5TLU1_9ACTN|nr:hypothetical protein [Kineosporia corallincola]MBT0772066.1 hypothetical protein [Kineosporia corallincola]